MSFHNSRKKSDFSHRAKPALVYVKKASQPEIKPSKISNHTVKTLETITSENICEINDEKGLYFNKKKRSFDKKRRNKRKYEIEYCCYEPKEVLAHNQNLISHKKEEQTDEHSFRKETEQLVVTPKSEEENDRKATIEIYKKEETLEINETSSPKKNDNKQKISSRKSSTIEQIISNVFDDFTPNDESWLYSSGMFTDLNIDQNNKAEEDHDFDFFIQSNPAEANLELDQKSKSVWGLTSCHDSEASDYFELQKAFRIWNNKYFFTKIPQNTSETANTPQPNSPFDPEPFFKNLFPLNSKNFEHKKFPIFSLFIQRIPHHDLTEEVWFYKDPQGIVQGPFDTNEMDYWNREGYFDLDLLIAWNQTKELMKLSEFVSNPQNLVKLAHSHGIINKYFSNATPNLGYKKNTDDKMKGSTLAFNSFSTSLINNPVLTAQQISTDSLKLMLGIPSGLS